MNRLLGLILANLLLASPALADVIVLGGSSGSSGLVSGTTAITGGATTQVCFNDGGTLSCGDAGFVYNKTTNVGTFAGGGVIVTSSGAGTPTHFEVPALSALTGADNYIIGTGAGSALTTSAGNIIIGSSAGNGATTGAGNSIFIGTDAGGGSNIGSANVAVGFSALDATTGTGAGSNVAIGSNSCGAVTTGSNNVCIGTSAASATLTTGTHNTIVGSLATVSANIGECIALGAAATCSAANQFVVGGSTREIDQVYIGESVTDASPGDVTIQSTGGSGTDIAGAGLYLAGGKGTGSAAPGELVMQTSVPGSTGTTLQSLATRTWIEGSQKTLTATVATAVVRIAIPQGSVSGGVFEYVVHANDATDYQSRSGRLNWQAVNKAGTETCVVGDGTAIETEDGSSIAQSSASTLTYAVTCASNAADTVDLEINAVSGLSETTLRVEQWRLNKNGGSGAVTPQ